MPAVFRTLDKVRPLYDFLYKVFMVICKVLLIADILITSYAVAGRYCQQIARKYEFLSFLGIIKDRHGAKKLF